MCFTINIHTTRDAIEKRFNADASALGDFEFRYFYRAFENPLIPVITQEDPGKVQLLQWGLIPHWAKDEAQAEKISRGTYNARAESLNDKPSFKKPVENQRCLVIACAFYEWQHAGRQKIPWLIHHREQEVFGIAGIFDRWRNVQSDVLETTFSVITTRANPLMEKIHNSKKRMPVILGRQGQEDRWLRNEIPGTSREKLLQPISQQELNAYTISKKISHTGADPNDPSVVEQADYHENRTLF